MTALFLVLQLTLAPDTLSSISLYDGARQTRIPIVRLEQAAMVSADRLASGLGGVVRRVARDRYILSVLGLELDLNTGSQLIRVNERIVPLASSPRLQGSDLLVPLALVADILPRLAPAPGVTYDPERGELRFVGRAVAGTRGPPSPATNGAPASVRSPPPKAKLVVVIDPGHGGPDRGMKGPLRGPVKYHEADLTLQIGHKLADALRKAGVEVIMTRFTDTLIALADRGRIANDFKADIFLSLHINAANPRWRNPGTARGFETYFLSEARTDDARRVEELENSSIQYEVDSLPSDDGLSFILNDMKSNESLRESQNLAEAVQQGMERVHPGPSRGVKQAGFRVLVAAIVPAVLVEVGFGSNAAEARYLASDAGQRALAGAIARATLGYLAAYERRRAQGEATH